MSILNRHIQKEIIRYFLYVMVTVLGIYLIADFFERIDNFISAGIAFKQAAIYYVYKIPIIIAQVLPICFLLAVIVCLGLMNRHNEIVALKSCGIGYGFILKPVMTLGVLCMGAMFLFSEIIVPITVPISNRIWVEDIKKKDIVTTREKDIWMKGNRSITHIQHYNPVEKNIYGISEYIFDNDFKLEKRMDARKGFFAGGQWVLNGILEQTRKENEGTYDITHTRQGLRTLAVLPEDLTTIVKKSEEMSYIELSDYIAKVESEGYDATTYRVDLYGKTALPFVCLILAMVGAGIGVKKHVREGLPVGIAYGIGIAFLYWIFNSFSLSLGYGGLVPPVLAAWVPNVVFTAWGIYLGLNN